MNENNFPLRPQEVIMPTRENNTGLHAESSSFFVLLLYSRDMSVRICNFPKWWSSVGAGGAADQDQDRLRIPRFHYDRQWYGHGIQT